MAACQLPDVAWERRLPVETARLTPAGGHAFRYDVRLDAPADKRGKRKSFLRVLEDGRPLGPAHDYPRRIELAGRGAYRHVEDHVLLSSSDGTDPRANGRRYELALPGYVPFPLQYLAVAAFAVFALGALPFAASRSALPPRARRIAAWAGGAAVVLIAWECLAKAVTQQLLFEDDGEFARELYQQVFQRGAAAERRPLFAPHAYLPYVLDPARRSNGRAETDERFLIRRVEPIRPRSEVALRILALGGSTTFDEKIAVEEDTWVRQLEIRLRRRYGQGVDVINGGVGGYTLYENAIHYLVLLTHLEPDVVLLFEGINDVHPRIYRNAHEDYRDYNTGWWDARRLELAPGGRLLAASSSGRLLLWLGHFRPMSQRGIEHLARKPYPPPESWRESLTATPPDLYRHMLENFVLLLKAQGRRPLIVAQAWRSLTASDRDFARGLAEQNAVNREVALRHALPFLPQQRLERALGDADFADNCHFTPSGAAMMAGVVAELLEESGIPAAVLGGGRAPR